ncbi:MAG: DUF885 family protein [Desulfobacteraceae bacterium]|jgi:hypothetical protein
MTPHRSGIDTSEQLDLLAREIYAALAEQFPVCLSSDEFHFFPHYRSERHEVGDWDDFSPDAVRSFLTRASHWRGRLEKLRPHPPVEALTINIELLSRVLTTLEGQLGLVQPQKSQPTFYLTILSIGLAQSLEQSRDAFGRRMAALPKFLAAAASNLTKVPTVFRDLAIEMISSLSAWITLLPLTEGRRSCAMAALQNFRDHLRRIQTEPDFRLDADLYALVADVHMGCGMGPGQIGRRLDDEIEAATGHLVESAGRISPGTPWQTVFHDLPCAEATDRDVAALYHNGIARLKEHCLQNGFFQEDAVAGCDVEIRTIAEHMMPVRANAAYSMPPGHPPTGGVFYILPADRQTLPRDMLLLAAHETFPGHHLLDTLRWRLDQPLRRCLEFPLFYEGWASFCEEILFDTGFFSGPVDRLLMAKRRLWRALRGRAELRIHTGRRRLREAAAELAAVGLVTPGQALAMVRRYALKPGYQLSYAIGRRRFSQLYKAYTGQGRTPAQFVKAALCEGEIGFDHLERRMLRAGQGP